MKIICGGSAEYYVNQKACYTGIPNIFSTVCISRTTQSRSELSADLTGVNVEVGWILFCLFREAIYERACTQCGLTMTSHNATRNAHDVMWKWTGWQRQRRTCYRVQYHNAASCSIYECLFELSSTTNILHCHLLHNKNTSPAIFQMYVSACFDRNMFRSKYARESSPWSFSMHCWWRHWGRGMHLLPLQHHIWETSLST